MASELDRLEAELGRLEAEYFVVRDEGPIERELALGAERSKLVERIVALERKLNPEIRREYEADQEADRRAEMSWHERKRDDALRREWERWRYQRSKRPPRQRPMMMKVGQRECRDCGAYFEPATLRQRFCSASCRKRSHKRLAG